MQTESPRKILIIGKKFHGKSTFGNFLKNALTDAEFFSTSEYLINRLALINGSRVDEILSNKELHRKDLIRLGNAMCKADAGCLVSICLWACRKPFVIIDGVRRNSEFSVVKDWFEKIIWIDRPDFPENGQDNLELTREDTHVVIQNNGSLDDFKKKAQLLAQELGF